MSDGQKDAMVNANKVVEDFKFLYQNLNASNINDGLIEQVYRDDIQFKDSFHELKGMSDFHGYFESVDENVIYSRFEFHEQLVDEERAMLTWTMNYAHPKLNNGNNIAVQGASHICYSDKVYYHQDYIDGGELLYEHIPVLGWVIQKLKDRMV